MTMIDVRQGFARAILGVLGWRFRPESEVDLSKGELHRFPPKFITFGEPHTHIADFWLMLLFFWYFRLPKVTFPVSKKYFNFISRPVLHWLGAIAVDTTAKNNLVAALIEKVKSADSIILHIPPSGTRKKTDRWRAGFWHIARGAEIPVIPAYLDGETKTFGYGSPLYMTGRARADMTNIRAFYRNKRGLVPAKESTIRLPFESDPSITGTG